jgi:hypothetical protein
MDEELRKRHEETARKQSELREQLAREGRSVLERTGMTDVVLPGHIGALQAPGERYDWSAAIDRITKTTPEQQAARTRAAKPRKSKPSARRRQKRGAVAKT